MDPTTMLQEIRALESQFHLAYGLGDLKEAARIANELIEHFDELDTWLCHSGFFPEPWRSHNRCCID